jgi:ribosomal protein S27AE
MRKCPNCGSKRFIVGVHVVQEWIVNEFELCDEVYNDFVDITHMADDQDIWQCVECGYHAIGEKFYIEDELIE